MSMSVVEKFGGIGVAIMAHRTELELALEDVRKAFERRKERQKSSLSKIAAIDFSKGDLLAKADALREAMRERLDADLESFAEIGAAQERALAAFPDFARWLGDSSRAIGPRPMRNQAASIGDAILNHRTDIRR